MGSNRMINELQGGKQGERVIYFDLLRITAMIAVIVLHTAASGWYGKDVHSFVWRTFNVYDSLVRWGVPVFTMISGALFLSPAKQISIKTLYSQYILRLVLAFIAWSCFYAVFSLEAGDGIKDFLTMFIEGYYHMWFLFMLVGLYIIIPPLRRITASAEATKYFLVISLVFSFIIPAIMLAMKCVDSLYGSSLYDLTEQVYADVNFHFAIGYSFYFVLGYFLSAATLTRRQEWICYILGIVGFCLTTFLTKGISYYFYRPNGTFYENMTINVMMESVAVFVLFKCRISSLVKRERTVMLTRKLSKLSFGVYLIHPFFLELLGLFGIDTMSFNPVLSVPLIAAVVFFLSLVVSAVLNKLPVIGKYLV